MKVVANRKCILVHGSDEISSLTGSSCPLGFSTLTSTSPLPAENVSTVNLAAARTGGPFGSMPGP